MKLKKAYDNFDQASDETGLECKDPTLTQQNQEEESNINNIVKRYTQTGHMPVHNLPPMTGDFSDAPDMQTAMNLAIEARMAFMEQPAEVRSRFNNDPAKFVEFCSDVNNKDDMRKMGLLSPEAVAAYNLEAENRDKHMKALEADAAAYKRAQEAPKANT